VLIYKAIRLISKVLANKNLVSFERKFTSTADNSDSKALVK
jgi:hypothetical protein